MIFTSDPLKNCVVNDVFQKRRIEISEKLNITYSIERPKVIM